MVHVLLILDFAAHFLLQEIKQLFPSVFKSENCPQVLLFQTWAPTFLPELLLSWVTTTLKKASATEPREIQWSDFSYIGVLVCFSLP